MKLFDYLEKDPAGEETIAAPYTGLSQREAEQRLAQYGKNTLQNGKKVKPFAIFICQFKDFLTMVLLACTAVTLFLGDYTEAMTIGVIVLLNGLMGFFQEYRTERTLEALRRMAAPKAKVYRDGALREVPGEEVVPGDLIALEAGDRVPADACLLETTALSADESILTGESAAVGKQAAGPDFAGDNSLHQQGLVYMGTIITTGRGVGRVLATGMESQVGRIAGMIGEIEEEPTPLQKKLDQLGRYIAFGCLGVCAIVAGAGLLRGEPLLDMLLTGVSLAVAAVPEGLPAIVTISLALAVGRMVKQRSLIRRLHAVETLGCTDVICSDKTGTLTENKMTVQQIWAGGERLEVSGSGYQKAGEFRLEDGRLADPNRFPPALRLLQTGVLCSNAAISAEKGSRSRAGSREAGEYAAIGDPTEIALLVAAAKASVTASSLAVEYRRLLEIPFDSKSKSMSVVVEGKNGQRLLLVKGGYDVLLSRCTTFQTADGAVPLTGALRRRIEEENRRMAGRALRVLGFAWKILPAGPLSEETAAGERGLTFAGLAGMMDPPRKEAAEAVKLSRRAGIRTVMITGDHRDTACAVARELGIWHEGDRVLTGAEISAMSDEALDAVIEQTAVFARVSPSDKLKIVRAFRRRGHITAMTGDGVNDAPAVREADIGVSMGISGTDVTKEASDLILLDDNFATLVAAVREGRVIYQNIRKFIRYLLSCNIGEVLTMFLGMLMGIPVVLLPIHILLINLVTDGLPAIALGLEPPEKDVMKRPPRRASDGVFSDGLLTTILFRGALIGLTTLAVFLHFWKTGDLSLARTGALLALVFAQLIHVFECKSEEKTIFGINPLNNWKLLLAVLFSSAVALAAVYFPPARMVFQTVPMDASQLLAVAGYLAAAPVLSAVLQKFFRNRNK